MDNLPSLDAELYKGLISLKNYEGNVEDLGLNFTINDIGNFSMKRRLLTDGEDLDVQKTISLSTSGETTPVTNYNRLQYIIRVADYRLNVKMKAQCQAFVNGLSYFVDPNWLRMFNQVIFVGDIYDQTHKLV